jgi:predicted heme/steroid binding protein
MASSTNLELTPDELAKYTGEKGSRIIFSVNKVLYDATEQGAEHCE